MRLKKNDVSIERNFDLIDFTFSFPYSSQVQDLIVDLVRRCVIDQTDEGYRLSSLGKKIVRNLR
jgi:predicted transcriptional regulator